MAQCSEHSGVCTSVSNINKDIDEIKAELNRYKGFVEGQLNGLSGEIRGIRKEMLDKLDATTKEIKDSIKETNTKTVTKTWNIINSLISPTIVGVVLFILSKLWK
jgi:hypothetical protein